MAKKKRGGSDMPIPVGNNQRIVIQDVATMVNQEKRITRVEMMFFFVLILLVVFVFFGDAIKAWLSSMSWWQKLVDNTPDWIKDNIPSSPTTDKDPITGKIPVVSAVLLSLAGLATTMILGYGAFVLFRRRRAKKVEREVQIRKGVDYHSLLTNSAGKPNEIDAIQKAMFITRLFEQKDRRGGHSKNSGLWQLATKETLIDVLIKLPSDSVVDTETFLQRIEERFRKEGGKIPRELKEKFEEEKAMLLEHLKRGPVGLSEEERELREAVMEFAGESVENKMKPKQIEEALENWFESHGITEDIRKRYYRLLFEKERKRLSLLPEIPKKK